MASSSRVTRRSKRVSVMDIGDTLNVVSSNVLQSTPKSRSGRSLQTATPPEADTPRTLATLQTWRMDEPCSTMHSTGSSSQLELSGINTLVETNSKLSQTINSQNDLIKNLQEDLTVAREEMKALRQELEAMKSAASSKSDGDLIRAIRSLYEALDDEEKFVTEQEITSDHNQKVMAAMKAHLKEDSHFTDVSLSQALKRRFYYERKKQKELLSDSDIHGQRRRRNVRRHNKYKLRLSIAKVVPEDAEFMKRLTAYDMSDEESFAEGGSQKLKIRKPTWRTPTTETRLKDLDGKKIRKKLVTTCPGSPSLRPRK